MIILLLLPGLITSSSYKDNWDFILVRIFNSYNRSAGSLRFRFNILAAAYEGYIKGNCHLALLFVAGDVT